ncbi:MAG: hypothetical protein JSW15_09625, partial [Deltaproteobacteria bacterium]
VLGSCSIGVNQGHGGLFSRNEKLEALTRRYVVRSAAGRPPVKRALQVSSMGKARGAPRQPSLAAS